MTQCLTIQTPFGGCWRKENEKKTIKKLLIRERGISSTISTSTFNKMMKKISKKNKK